MGKERIKERFNLEAVNWDTLPRRIEAARAVVENLLPYLKPTDRVLEMGCGTGLVGLSIAPFVKEVVGIDLSDQMVERFNRKAEELGVKNGKAYHADIYEITPEEWGEFDWVISSMTLHHIPDIPRLVAHLSQIAPNVGIADLVVEDGSFHTRGNGDVFHFGFRDEELIRWFKPFYPTVEFKIIHTIRKEVKGQKRGYPMFLLIARRYNATIVEGEG